jgi:Tol biopolymer transport system component
MRPGIGSTPGKKTGATEEGLTSAGAVLGTVGYMAPEQVLGQEVDGRADVFALGAVLYEMATGWPAFVGDTPGKILEGILNRAPTAAVRLNPQVPAKLEAIIAKALEKDRKLRYQSAAELKADLQRLKRDTESGRAGPLTAPVLATSSSTHRRALAGGALALAVVFVVIALRSGWFTEPPSERKPELRQQQLTANSTQSRVSTAAISPDGKFLAYVDTTGISLEGIEGGEVHSLPLPEGFLVRRVSWFPDATKMLLMGRAVAEEGSGIWVISILGGKPRKLWDDVQNASVSPDGSYIGFINPSGSEIWVMGSNGEGPHRVLAANEGERFAELAWSPDARRVAIGRFIRGEGGMLLFQVETRTLDGGQATVILWGPWHGGDFPFCWTADGRIVYSLRELAPNEKDSNLWSIGTDLETAQASGNLQRITNWAGFFLRDLSAKADGKRLAFLKERSHTDIYVGELEAKGTRLKAPRRLTLDDWSHWPKAWTHDSKTVLYDSDRNGKMWDIYKQGLEDRTAEMMVMGPERKSGACLTADGAWLLYWASSQTEANRLMRVSSSGGPPQLVLVPRGDAVVRCPSLPAASCVLSEADQKQFVFSLLDPVKGKGSELARIGRDAFASDLEWDISPDGSQAISVVKGHIRILALKDRATRDVSVEGWSRFGGVVWSADGGSLLATSESPRSALLRVDLGGRAYILWDAEVGAVVPSPDGRHLALAGRTTDSNAWMIENF